MYRALVGLVAAASVFVACGIVVMVIAFAVSRSTSVALVAGVIAGALAVVGLFHLSAFVGF